MGKLDIMKRKVKDDGGIHIDEHHANEYLEPELRKGDLMTEILEGVSSRYWKEVVHDVLAGRDPFLYKIISHSTRGDYENIRKTNRNR